MKRRVPVLVVALVFAVVLSVGVASAGNSALQMVQAGSGEVNSSSAQASFFDVWSTDWQIFYNTTINASVTAVYPRVVEDNHIFQVSLVFNMTLPANTSYFWVDTVDAYFIFYAYNSNNFLLAGYYMPRQGDTGITINGSRGSLNTTVEANLGTVAPSWGWFSFANELETHPRIVLQGYGLVGVNGSKVQYYLQPIFYLDGNTTVYVFAYPTGAVLGYGASALIGTVSLGLLIYTARKEGIKKNMKRRREAKH